MYCVCLSAELPAVTSVTRGSRTHLDKVQPSVPVMAHNKNSHVCMRVLDGLVQRPRQHIGVLGEFNHELLFLLHRVEILRSNRVRIMEKQIRFAA